MALDPQVLWTYLDHFLPRDVLGPVIIVFSLEGVIDGVFTRYVPSGAETMSWALVFGLSVLLVTYWGTHDEDAVEDLQEELEEVRES